MKRNRTRALDYVLAHRKKVIKGLGALIQILEAFPDGVTGADLLAARKSRARAAKAAKTKPRRKPKAKKAGAKKASRAARSKKPARKRTAQRPAEARPPDTLAVTSGEQPPGDVPMP